MESQGKNEHIKKGRDAVYMVETAKLIPYARNARQHSAEQVAQIAALIREYGFTAPILVDEELGILAGHGRLAAARLLELETVPVIFITGLSPAQKRAYILADNKVAINAGWDPELLRLDLSDLKDAGVDIGLTGFSAAELESLFDDAPELPPPTGGSGPADELEDVLKFGNFKIPLTEAEALSFRRRLARHVKETGGYAGFVAEILKTNF